MLSVLSARYFLYRGAADLRKSYDGLCGMVSAHLGGNARSGDVYIFINKSRDRCKLLRWEPGGFVLFCKRLERGTFELPGWESEGMGMEIEYGQLAMLITGFSLKHARKRKRF